MIGRLRDKGGSVFVGALMLVLVMTLVGVSLFDLGVVETRLVEGDKVSAQTIYCTEAGIARALAEIIPAPDDPLSWAGATQTLPTAEGNCQYVASDVRITFPRQLRVTATIGSLSQQTIEVTAQAFSHGVVSGGGNDQPFVISGPIVVQGSCGSFHTNGDLEIPGTATFDGNVTSSGSYDAGGKPVIDGQSGGGHPTQPVPAVDPAQFLAVAKATPLVASELFQLKSNGQILDGNDFEIVVLTDGEVFRGWEYKPGSSFEWIYGNDTPFDGTYYMEGSVMVSSSPGTETTPWVTSIIATENILFSGNPSLSPHLTDTLLVAGLDIEISGNPDHTINGIIAAHEQININGNPTIVGNIVAEDTPSTSDFVTQSIISGEASITYDCQLNPGVGAWQVGVWIWQECNDPACST